jgi:hypothetical protein
MWNVECEMRNESGEGGIRSLGFEVPETSNLELRGDRFTVRNDGATMLLHCDTSYGGAA